MFAGVHIDGQHIQIQWNYHGFFGQTVILSKRLKRHLPDDVQTIS